MPSLAGVDAVVVPPEAHGVGHHHQPPGSRPAAGEEGPKDVLRVEDIHVMVHNDEVFQEFEAAEGGHDEVLGSYSNCLRMAATPVR